jgi:hypothetical protein
VAITALLVNRVEQLQRANQVVDLRQDGVVPVNHREGRRTLLPKEHDRVWLELPQLTLHEFEVRDIAD